MEKNILIINIGSTSKRYALYAGDRCLFHSVFTEGESFFHVLDILKDTAGVSTEDIGGIGMRVVASGTFFTEHRIIDDGYEQKLSEAEELDPLHITPVREEMRKIRTVFRKTPFAAVSDSSFHKTMESSARIYGISKKDTEQFDLYRFGYHGISLSSVVRKLPSITGEVPKRTVVCHLGGGSSVTALLDGKSMDSSMGFTPLEGVPMGSRSGDVGSGALVRLLEKKKFSPSSLFSYLNTECGMLGISGITGDMQKLLELEPSDTNAKDAIALYVYSIKKYIGSYAAILGGLDLLVFTGGIGEHAPVIRARICSGLRFLGVESDEEKNRQTTGENGIISTHDSSVSVVVIATDEMKEIYQSTTRLFLSSGLKLEGQA